MSEAPVQFHCPYAQIDRRVPCHCGTLTVLDKSNIGGLLTEALTANVETVFSDETGLVCADTAGAGSLAVGSGT